MERAADADLALEPDRAAHQRHELGGDREARGRCRRTSRVVECRPARTPRRSRRCLSAGIPMPVSDDREVQRDGVLVERRALDVHDDFAALGELDRVADQIRQHLPQPARDRRRARRARRTRMWQASSRLFCCARIASVFIRSSTVSRSGKRMCSSSSLRASIFEKSRMSLMIAEQRLRPIARSCRRSRAARR